MNYPPEVTVLGNSITHIEGINDITFSKGSTEDRYIEKAYFANGEEIPQEILNNLDSDYIYELEVNN
mgnify:CR=1 FL=1